MNGLETSVPLAATLLALSRPWWSAVADRLRSRRSGAGAALDPSSSYWSRGRQGIGEPFGGATVRAADLRARRSTVWLLSTVASSIVAYILLIVLYYLETSGHRVPSMFSIFGRGDLGLVVSATLCATLAEIGRVRASGVRRFVVVPLLVILSGLASTTFAFTGYQALANRHLHYALNAVLLGSLLLGSVLLHLIVVRRKD